jgi:hypothetical protein
MLTAQTGQSSCSSSAARFWHHRESESDPTVLVVGVSDAWLEEKVPGDVDKVTLSSSSTSTSTSALNIEYSGLSYSEADELYHSVWSNTEGTVSLTAESMLPPHIIPTLDEVTVNPSVLKAPYLINESTWLFRVKTAERE